jgi:hypothetical protein
LKNNALRPISGAHFPKVVRNPYVSGSLKSGSGIAAPPVDAKRREDFPPGVWHFRYVSARSRHHRLPLSRSLDPPRECPRRRGKPTPVPNKVALLTTNLSDSVARSRPRVISPDRLPSTAHGRSNELPSCLARRSPLPTRNGAFQTRRKSHRQQPSPCCFIAETRAPWTSARKPSQHADGFREAILSLIVSKNRLLASGDAQESMQVISDNFLTLETLWRQCSVGSQSHHGSSGPGSAAFFSRNYRSCNYLHFVTTFDTKVTIGVRSRAVSSPSRLPAYPFLPC